MVKERKIGFSAAVMLMSAALLSACGKINLPTLLVLDSAASNTFSITLPASLGGGTVTSNLVGNMNTTVTIDTSKLISPQGVPATIAVNSFDTAGSAISLGGGSSGTLCTSIPKGEEAGGIAYLRPIINRDAMFQLTIPTETKSVRNLFPPILLILNIDATVPLDLMGLLNLLLKGTGLSMHPVATTTIPASIPLLGGSAVTLDTTLKSTKTPVTNPLLDECQNASKCGNGVVESDETCDIAIPAGQPGACPTWCSKEFPGCETWVLQGSGCTVECVFTLIVPCCGNGLLDAGEICDYRIQAGQPGACPRNCTDGDACTADALTGSAVNCNVVCKHTPIVPCPTCAPPLVFHPGLGMCASLEGLEGLGADCSSKACKQGQWCTSYYGIAGPAGPLFSSCVLPCGPEPDNLCPEGLTCGSWSADGPTIPTCG